MYISVVSLPPNIYLVPHLYCSIVGALFENPFGISLELCSMKHNVLIYSVVTERWMNLLNGEQLDSDSDEMNCLWPPTATAEKLNLSEAKSVMLDKIKDSTSSTRYYIIPDTIQANCLHGLQVQHTSPLCSSSSCPAIFYITSFQ